MTASSFSKLDCLWRLLPLWGRVSSQSGISFSRISCLSVGAWKRERKRHASVCEREEQRVPMASWQFCCLRTCYKGLLCFWLGAGGLLPSTKASAPSTHVTPKGLSLWPCSGHRDPVSHAPSVLFACAPVAGSGMMRILLLAGTNLLT